MLFNASSPVFQYDTWPHGNTVSPGDEKRPDVNLTTFQPFMFYQSGGGTYLRAAPVWAYNAKNSSYSVPMGLGIDQVTKQKKTVYNVLIEPQGSVAGKGLGQPRWQIFAGLNLQLLD